MIRWAAVALLLAGCTRGEDPAIAAAKERLPRASYPVPALGLRVSYLHAGAPNGQTVIFVHGTPGSARGWADYLIAVPEGYRFIAVDRPGFGRSRPGHPLPSLERQAEALAPLLLDTDPPPILVGHSLGAPIIALLAANHPQRVGALILLAGALDPAKERIYWYQRVAEWPGVRSLVPEAWRVANRELLPLKSELERLAPKLDRIRAPIVIVHGTEDRLVPVGNIEFMRPRFSRAASVRVIVLKGQGHFLPWEQKPLIDRVIRETARS
jgi:pimeloyl-ACP methyl ester carboxylesterase